MHIAEPTTRPSSAHGEEFVELQTQLINPQPFFQGA